MSRKKTLRELSDEIGKEIMRQEAKAMQDHASKVLKDTRLITDYNGKYLSDLVENSVEISMELIRRNLEETRNKKGIGERYTPKQFLQQQINNEAFKRHFDYFTEFFNCCRFERFASAISDDTKSMLLALHRGPEINRQLRAYGKESYEAATLQAARNLKGKLIAFWNTYLETLR